MELIILGLGGSLWAVLSQLLEFISQRPGRALPTIAATQTVRKPAELRATPQTVTVRPRTAQGREMSSRRYA